MRTAPCHPTDGFHMSRISRIFRLEIRTDFTGTEDQARFEAQRLANECDGEVTAIFDVDDDYDEL
ncbi:hypothetical protein [Nocardia africana]